MATQLHLDDLRRAWEARDPELVRLVQQLINQPDEPPKKPVRSGAPTFQKFINEMRGGSYRRKTKEEKAHFRLAQLKTLEAPTAEVPLSDKLRSHEILMLLWQDNSLFARQCLLKIIATVPLTYGPWKALKKIFKEAEGKGDTEIFGALAARFDMAYSRNQYQLISPGTMAYLVRRGWRYLRRLGVQLPACYADACVDFLVHYTNDTNWRSTWIANHIFYHQTKQYGFARFRFHREPDSLTTFRAFEELWKRTPRPLFSLLERAQSEKVWEFASAALKSDFRAVLREVEPAWVIRLVNIPSKTVHDFIVWILNNVPRFEQGAFRSLGLHEAVLRLFDSPSQEARAYAAEYARTHARDLPISELIRLANNDNDKVRQLAFDLLQARDPRKDVGLEAWGQLLETKHGHKLAAQVLRNHFGASELTPDWFKERLFTENQQAFQFIRELLVQIHPPQKLGSDFFAELIDRIQQPYGAEAQRVAQFALQELPRFDLNKLDRDRLRRMLLLPSTQNQILQWVNEGRLQPQSFGVEFLKTLAFHPDLETDAWFLALKDSGRVWARQLGYNENLANQLLLWLGDVRKFSTSELGFDWLMKLVKRSEPRYHDFAVETMIKAFVPADFAPKTETAAATTTAAAVQVDLAGASFLFTGKLATMTRNDAEGKVKAANGVVFSAVSSKLQYLVVGDEGSPLYGQGKKGSKQTRAEEINEAGGNIKIISETAFLQMLAGKQQTYSEDATLAGCERLWQMAIAGGAEDAPLAQFARKYIRWHHPEIGKERTGKPVDPGAEIPLSFLTFERVGPLFTETRKPLRDLALDLAQWEFARWSPPVESLIRLCESPYGEVRGLVMKSLLADDTPEHKHYRIDPEKLSPAAVYSFCESPAEETRLLGMELIRRYPRFQVPEELFRLTESPDRKVRGFVVRSLWGLYRDRAITRDWKPAVLPQTTVGSAARKAAAEAEKQRGEGPPKRPEQLPTTRQGMQEFLRRILFEIPPGRFEGKKPEPREGITIRLKPLPARKAKLHLVEVMRDLALEEKDFATGVLPLFEEFMHSRGKSEYEACLVAVTRVGKRYPELNHQAELQLEIK